jgi:hypothetical protein
MVEGQAPLNLRSPFRIIELTFKNFSGLVLEQCKILLMEKNFFEKIPGFRDFNDLTHSGHYHSAPSDWSLIITDVKGSTKAIAEGRYKDVNMIGAAAIVLARQVMGEEDFPFVFGGDGATFLIPPEKLHQTLSALSSLQNLSQKNFMLELRVGHLPLAEMRQAGHTFKVAKYELLSGQSIAVFYGPGVQWAEGRIKSDPDRYCQKASDAIPSDLSALSCRWNAIPSKRGKILSLLVMAHDSRLDIYGKIMKRFAEIFPEEIEINPVKTQNMSYKSVRDLLLDEERLHSKTFGLGFLIRAFEIFIAVLAFGKGLCPGPLRRYRQSMPAHSDYRKFDDVLRMTIDASQAEIAALRSFLDDLHHQGEICFGLFEADAALMTCVVESIRPGNHIHFIDADKGGYAMAALQLKQQLQTRVAL